MARRSEWTMKPIVNGDTVLDHANCKEAAQKVLMLDSWGMWSQSFFDSYEETDKTYSATDPFPA